MPSASPVPSAAIVGNRRNQRSHRPDRPGENQVSAQNRVPFVHEREALAARYRGAGNSPRVLYDMDYSEHEEVANRVIACTQQTVAMISLRLVAQTVIGLASAAAK